MQVRSVVRLCIHAVFRYCRMIMEAPGQGGDPMAGRKHKRGREGWTPNPNGPKPPFAPGNDLAVTHGVYSPGRVAPRAEHVLEELLTPAGAAQAPDMLRSPLFAPALRIAARRVAQAEMMHDHLEGMPVEEQIEPPKPGTSAPIEQLRKLDAAAQVSLAVCGLTPAAAVKMGAQMASAAPDLALLIAEAEAS